jgi:hypothetical protein
LKVLRLKNIQSLLSFNIIILWRTLSTLAKRLVILFCIVYVYLNISNSNFLVSSHILSKTFNFNFSILRVDSQNRSIDAAILLNNLLLFTSWSLTPNKVVTLVLGNCGWSFFHIILKEVNLFQHLHQCPYH